MLLCTCLRAQWGWVCAALWTPCWQNWCDLFPAHWRQSAGDPPDWEKTSGGQVSLPWPLRPPLRPHTASSSCSPWCERQMATRRTDGSWRSWWYVPRSPSPRSHSHRRLRRGGRCRRTRSGQLEALCAAWQMSSSSRRGSDSYRSILGRPPLVFVNLQKFLCKHWILLRCYFTPTSPL